MNCLLGLKRMQFFRSSPHDRSFRSERIWYACNARAIWISAIFDRYQEMFAVTGPSWCKDPGTLPAEEDGFGMKNPVLIVE
jgi:hypothetical protein